MSMRSRTRSESSSMKPAVPNKSQARQAQRSQKADAMSEDDETGKENKKVVRPRGKAKGATAQRKPRAATKKEYCVCKQPDDGTPMVNCSECKDWYHFRCVDLNEKDADEISIYICPACTTSTGRRTVMDWEGPDALEECSDVERVPAHEPTPQISEESADEEPEAKVESESDDEGTEDDYIAETEKPKGKGVAKRRARRLSLTSESESDEEEAAPPGRASASKRETKATLASSNLKRKTHATSQQPPPKRQKSAASSATGDPTRTYCLKKLQEVFSEIFLRYPNIPDDGAADGQSVSPLADKKSDELTDIEKAKVEEAANKFATELEQCVYDIYSEPDAKGKIHAGSKYKERFRMLTFNLGKPDRVILHKRIAALHILPKELSLMSSTDLADEDTKQSIKIAEKEALEHSILQKTTAPRAKITHKGMVDIEDVDSERSGMRERERERELEEEERRERERTARLRAAQAQQRRASQSQGSVPPESPVTPHHTGSWGGPPTLPIHAMQTSETTSILSPSLGPARSSVETMFPSSNSDFNTYAEPQLDLADLINIDDEPPPHAGAVSSNLSNPSVVSPPEVSPPAEGPAQSVLSASLSPGPSPASPTGISPFAATASRPEVPPPPRSSFDLNALWTAPAPKSDTPAISVPSPSPAQEEHKENLLDAEILGQGADDQDFDMFLEKDQDEQKTAAPVDESPEAQQAILDSQPRVWSGKVSMPLDSTIPQETPVVARQVGGRQLGADSLLWKTLFPSGLLRIDGRVPVDKSAQYLLQMRMNSTKELIAVALSPASPSDQSGCKTLSEYLVGKNRHGLVFPWGSRSKDQYPGRELYIIPLHATEPLPDYMELLDDLRLPKTRISDLLVGIWILNKGKLAPPAMPQVVPTPVLPAALPAPASTSAGPPPPSIVPPATTPLQISPDVFAAEVASLTPEQIKLMLQTLSASNALPPAAATQSPISPPHNPISTSPPQPWQGNPAAYHGPYGYQHMQQPHSQPPYPQSQMPFNRYDQGHSNYDRSDHGGRGWNNDNRGRGRGRGRGYDDQRKPLDSGWAGSRSRGNWDGPSRGRARGSWT